ncbi:DUF4157 domain-containing protein [Streptomyces sp. NPDC091376]|uniref:eCIS core domain-containing protein n=1 Tax=Streptomyces sp. NPDC091376 TaxID=3365994 RepID=UPI00381E3610
MIWPFRRRGGARAGRRQSAVPQVQAAAAPGGGSPTPAWAGLRPLAGPLARRKAPLTAPVRTGQASLAATDMLTTGIAGPAPSEAAVVGRVEGLVKVSSLRHPSPRRQPEGALPFPGLLPPRPETEVPAPAPSPIDVPLPVVRPAVVDRGAQPQPGLLEATKSFVGEPRPATESTHPPAWMNPMGMSGLPLDLQSFLFPAAAEDSTPAPGPPAAAARPERAHPPLQQAARSRRRNLGESRRLGLGPALSHAPRAEEPDSPGESRPPPAAPAADVPPPAPGHGHSATPTPPPAVPPTLESVPFFPPARSAPLPDDGGMPPAALWRDDEETQPAERSPATELAHRPAGRSDRRSRAPQDLASAISALHGVDVTSATVRQGPEASQEASDMSARAFTRDQEVHLPEAAGDPDAPRTRGLIAHELTHVAQQKRYGGSLPAENTPAGRALEAEALSAERYFRGDAGAPPPLVHRRPVTSGLDPDEVRRLVAQMMPGQQRPAPEPEPGAGPSSGPEPAAHVHELAGASWTPDTGLVSPGVQRASSEEILKDYIDELNHERRYDGLEKLSNISDLTARQKDTYEFRVGRERERGRLNAADQEDVIEGPLDGHWLSGQVGLGLSQGLASTFGVNMDKDRRAAVRDFFSARPEDDDEDDDEDEDVEEEGEGLPGQAAEAPAHGGTGGPRPPARGAVPAVPGAGRPTASSVPPAVAAPPAMLPEEEETPRKGRLKGLSGKNEEPSQHWLLSEAKKSVTEQLMRQFGLEPGGAQTAARAEEVAKAAPAPAPAATAPAKSAQPELDELYLDRLASRIYGRLRSQLRGELLVDRERSGRLNDFG